MTGVFLDTPPLIYLAEGKDHRRDAVERQLGQWISSNTMLASSALTLLELLVVPKREKNLRLELQYRSLLSTMLSEPLIPMDVDIATMASGYRADLGFRTPDAIQLATAVHHGFDVFYTNDHRLQKCLDISIVLVEPKS